ncbi:MAG: hypothetical protein AAGF47_03395 [Planctomycetota bacterium]
MLAVRLVMVTCIAAFSLSLTPASAVEADECKAGELPGNSCPCCM